ncbi:heme utilization cystosolic carrier protein HutX [Candidatus Cetobacterium colombiensis]|uniref:Heme utilization cystosolic carrier protein HutX n=1 Tax=Candidatus Cetobacterium colombiensis TaxID=3073100 RepID=A0ABU4WAF3_9FUSO|nr:heme utilization cystosolic carrier protein HutX [Candidatus Cetobacterium colombiensis]MDX8335468.1 heme utilization cystosolic carrier protein HutX [Candidatus Cetobacterium colombiensis]
MESKIKEMLSNDEKISLSKICKDLEISMIQVLREAPTVKKYNIEKIDELFEILRGWEKVFLLVVTPNFVLEIQDKFPKGFYAHGFLNFHDKETSIGGHLSVGKIKEIFLVKDIMFGRESYSIKFFGEDEKEIFAVYVPRNEKKELIEECLESFKKL